MRWKIFRNHNFLAQPDISVHRQRTKNFHKCPHVEPQPAPSVSPLSDTVATVSSHSPLLFHFFLFFSLHVLCRSSVFKVQTTEAGCLSPEAVIDRLTKRERERNRAALGGRVSQGKAEKDAWRACLNRRVYFCLSRCVIIGQETPGTHGMR